MEPEDLPPPLAFDALRRVAIGAAQAASGAQWTDYNTHDPGVTLLEQTLYALTELAYRGDHTVRDLLTDAEAGFDLHRLGLFPPRDVLPGRPVTLSDLGRCLSTLPEVDRVFVRPAPETGLIDLMVIPARDAGADAAVAAVRAEHGRCRLIGSDTGRVLVARAHPVRVEARIALDPRALPERVAAEVLHRVRLVLHGLADPQAGENDEAAVAVPRRGALWREVFADPARIWPEVGADAAGAAEAEAALAVLGRVPGVASVESFRLVDAVTGLPPGPGLAGFGTYLDPVLPRTGERGGIGAAGLVLLRDGDPVPAEPARIAEELARLAALRIAARASLKDPDEEDIRRPGRARTFARAPVDAHLPAIYRTGQASAAPRPLRPGDPGAGQAAALLTAYRGLIERHLDRVSDPVAHLPAWFAARTLPQGGDPDRSAFARAYGGAEGGAFGAVEALSRRREVLDYLLALQGCEVPAPLPAALHAYRSAAEAAVWEVEWREALLTRLPEFDGWSGTAHPENGFAARLALLADVGLPEPPGAEDPLAALAEAGLRPEAGAPPSAGEVPRARLILPSRPLDMLLPHESGAVPADPAALAAALPGLARAGRIDPSVFAAAAQCEAWLLARDRAGDWQVLLDTGGEALHAGPAFSDRARAAAAGNALRAGFAALNRTAERLVVVEDIRLRAAEGSGAFVPGLVHVFLPGFTARGADPAFRRHVETLVEALAPAHVRVDLHWLAPAERDQLRAALARQAGSPSGGVPGAELGGALAAELGPAPGPALGAAPDAAAPALEAAGVAPEAVAGDRGAALRAFLAGLEAPPAARAPPPTSPPTSPATKPPGAT